MLMGLASLVSGSGVSNVSHALDVRGLRKHVQRSDSRYCKDTVRAQGVQVSRHRGGMAGYINQLPGGMSAEKFDHRRMAAFPRRVHQHGGFSG